MKFKKVPLLASLMLGLSILTACAGEEADNGKTLREFEAESKNNAVNDNSKEY